MQTTTNKKLEGQPTDPSPFPSIRQTPEFPGLETIKLSSIHPRGTVLFSEGQPAKGVYLLAYGRVKVSISAASGKTMVLRIAQPGDLLGINSALHESLHCTTVETLERCRIDFVPRADFISLVEYNPKARAALAYSLGSELNEIVKRARLLLLSESATEKLARLLLEWCEDGEVRPEGIRLKCGLRQEEIAQMICASRETVTRLFAMLKRKGILSFVGSSIFVRDVRGLESQTGASEYQEFLRKSVMPVTVN